MRHASRLFVIGGALTLGLGALVLMPAADGTGSANTAQAAAPAPVATPAPSLLETLDAELAPPLPSSYSQGTIRPIQQVAAVAPQQVASPAEELASSSEVPADPVLRTDAVGAIAVNLRAGPSTSADAVSVLDPGAALSVVETNGGWVHVRLSDGRDGWVYSSYLASSGAGAAAVADKPIHTASLDTPRAVVQSDGGELENRTAHFVSALPAYARPTDSAPSVFAFQPGDRGRIVDVRGDWLEIETEDGMTVWIRR